LARLKDAENAANSLESRFDLAYGAACGVLPIVDETFCAVNRVERPELLARHAATSIDRGDLEGPKPGWLLGIKPN
jgi:hypothetical protein